MYQDLHWSFTDLVLFNPHSLHELLLSFYVDEETEAQGRLFTRLGFEADMTGLPNVAVDDNGHLYR